MRTNILKVGRQVEEVKRCARCVKSGTTAGNEISTEGTVDGRQRKRKKKKGRKGATARKRRIISRRGARKKPTGPAAGGVCGVGAPPPSPPPDKERFGNHPHFAGSII